MADWVELKASAAGAVFTETTILLLPAAVTTLHKLVRLSAAMEGDAAFARQARRKCLWQLVKGIRVSLRFFLLDTSHMWQAPKSHPAPKTLRLTV